MLVRWPDLLGFSIINFSAYRSSLAPPVHYHAHLSTLMHIHQLSCALINSHAHSSTFMRTHQLSCALVNSHAHSWTRTCTHWLSVHSSTLMRTYQLSCELTDSHEHSSTFMQTHWLSRALIDSHSHSSTLMRTHRLWSYLTLILLSLNETNYYLEIESSKYLHHPTVFPNILCLCTGRLITAKRKPKSIGILICKIFYFY